MKEFDIKLGYSCNNSCIFCLNKDKRKIGKFSFDFLKENIQKAAVRGMKKLIISGGEPTIRDDIFEIMDIAKKSGFDHIQIQTNGRRFYYKKYTLKFNKYAPLSFLVSFHFPNSALYKKYSGGDGFNQVTKGIKNILSYDHELVTNTVIMKPNLSYLEKTVEILKHIGVKNIQLRFIEPENVFHRFNEFVPTYTECKEQLIRLLDKNKDINIIIGNFPHCILPKNYLINMADKFNPNRQNLTSKGIIITERIIKDKFIYIDKCKLCNLSKRCYGLGKTYFKFYGDSEFIIS